MFGWLWPRYQAGLRYGSGASAKGFRQSRSWYFWTAKTTCSTFHRPRLLIPHFFGRSRCEGQLSPSWKLSILPRLIERWWKTATGRKNRKSPTRHAARVHSLSNTELRVEYHSPQNPSCRAPGGAPQHSTTSSWSNRLWTEVRCCGRRRPAGFRLRLIWRVSKIPDCTNPKESSLSTPPLKGCCSSRRRKPDLGKPLPKGISSRHRPDIIP